MAKGQQFERDFCKRLSLWWSDGKRSDVFWRTSNSGGRATVRAEKGESTIGQYGDVAAIHPKGEPLLKLFTFELKTGYANATAFNEIDKPRQNVQLTFEKWYRKVIEDSNAAKSASWLIVHQRLRRRAVCYMRASICGLLYYYKAFDGRRPRNKATFNLFGSGIVVFALDDFFKLKPSILRKMVNFDMVRKLMK